MNKEMTRLPDYEHDRWLTWHGGDRKSFEVVFLLAATLYYERNRQLWISYTQCAGAILLKLEVFYIYFLAIY